MKNEQLIFKEKDVVIIGGGPAGLAAAISAYKSGAKDILLLERDSRLGGILNQCIHDGFGLHYFKEALTGPEYSQRFIDMLNETDIEVQLESMALSLSPDKVLEVSSKNGYQIFKAKSIVLAMGCRERTAGAISLAGSRPAGIYTAGAAQNFINLQNIMVGKKAVILGSGDIGLIMARRMTLEGAEIKEVLEIMPYSNGLPRNIQQCLNDYNIPLNLNTTVIQIHGKKRLKGVTVAKVDKNRQPILSTKRYIKCDTLLLSVGLIPENELSRQATVQLDKTTGGALVDEHLMTNIEGIFACGNVLHVHDLVDFVTEEAMLAGHNAAYYAKNHNLGDKNKKYIKVMSGNNVSYCLPQQISDKTDVTISLRTTIATRNKSIIVNDENNNQIVTKKVIRVHPAEMLRIKINSTKLKKVKELKVSIV